MSLLLHDSFSGNSTVVGITATLSGVGAMSSNQARIAILSATLPGYGDAAVVQRGVLRLGSTISGSGSLVWTGGISIIRLAATLGGLADMAAIQGRIAPLSTSLSAAGVLVSTQKMIGRISASLAAIGTLTARFIGSARRILPSRLRIGLGL